MPACQGRRQLPGQAASAARCRCTMTPGAGPLQQRSEQRQCVLLSLLCVGLQRAYGSAPPWHHPPGRWSAGMLAYSSGHVPPPQFGGAPGCMRLAAEVVWAPKTTLYLGYLCISIAGTVVGPFVSNHLSVPAPPPASTAQRPPPCSAAAVAPSLLPGPSAPTPRSSRSRGAQQRSTGPARLSQMDALPDDALSAVLEREGVSEG